jgi:hypothetical protein
VVAQAVQPAVSRVVSTFVDARESLLCPEDVATNGDAAGLTARATDYYRAPLTAAIVVVGLSSTRYA